MKNLLQMQNGSGAVHRSANISFTEVPISRINRVIPKGYRLQTQEEAKRDYETDPVFKADVNMAGQIWVLGLRDGKPSPVCARAYCGLFMTDKPESEYYRPTYGLAHVAYVRDKRIEISVQDERKVVLRNALRRGVQSVMREING